VEESQVAARRRPSERPGNGRKHPAVAGCRRTLSLLVASVSGAVLLATMLHYGGRAETGSSMSHGAGEGGAASMLLGSRSTRASGGNGRRPFGCEYLQACAGKSLQHMCMIYIYIYCV